jgi:hypothetical protein
MPNNINWDNICKWSVCIGLIIAVILAIVILDKFKCKQNFTLGSKRLGTGPPHSVLDLGSKWSSNPKENAEAVKKCKSRWLDPNIHGENAGGIRGAPRGSGDLWFDCDGDIQNATDLGYDCPAGSPVAFDLEQCENPRTSQGGYLCKYNGSPQDNFAPCGVNCTKIDPLSNRWLADGWCQ